MAPLSLIEIQINLQNRLKAQEYLNTALMFKNWDYNEDAIIYLREALMLAKNYSIAEVEAEACYRLGRLYDKCADNKNALEHYKKYLEIVESLNDNQGQENAHWCLSLSYAEYGNIERAILHAIRHFAISRMNENLRSENVARRHINKLRRWIEKPPIDTKGFQKLFHDLIQGIRTNSSTNKLETIMKLDENKLRKMWHDQNREAKNLWESCNPAEAINYHETNIAISRDLLKDINLNAATYESIGKCFQYLGKFNEAIFNFDKIIEIGIKHDKLLMASLGAYHIKNLYQHKSKSITTFDTLPHILSLHFKYKRSSHFLELVQNETEYLDTLSLLYKRIGKSLDTLYVAQTRNDKDLQLVANFSLGDEFSVIRNYGAAKNCYLNAIALSYDIEKDFMRILLEYNLYQCYWKLNEREEALQIIHLNPFLNKIAKLKRSERLARANSSECDLIDDQMNYIRYSFQSRTIAIKAENKINVLRSMHKSVYKSYHSCQSLLEDNNLIGENKCINKSKIIETRIEFNWSNDVEEKNYNVLS